MSLVILILHRDHFLQIKASSSKKPLNMWTNYWTGNVSYEVPAIHPVYGIPVTQGAFNHTLGFAAAAATTEAHRLTLITGKAMAGVALKVLMDDQFARQVKDNFDIDQSHLAIISEMPFDKWLIYPTGKQIIIHMKIKLKGFSHNIATVSITRFYDLFQWFDDLQVHSFEMARLWY